jgi:sodium transport system ATP-binding protein
MHNNALINNDPAHSDGIVVNALTKQYGDFVAVNNISFHVAAGQIVGLLGPNGAGKTTTLRMLAGIMGLSSGHIHICGYDIQRQLLAVRRKIGFLSNDTQLYRRLSARENMRYFGSLHELPAATVAERSQALIEQFEMQAFADRPIEKLSSGQKQRANIARVLVHDPQVLILDEITASLDIISSQFIMEFLRKARQRNRCILFSTHIMSEAEYLCDDILLIHQGHILDRGGPNDLIAKTQANNLTEAFLNRVAQLDAGQHVV